MRHPHLAAESKSGAAALQLSLAELAGPPLHFSGTGAGRRGTLYCVNRHNTWLVLAEKQLLCRYYDKFLFRCKALAEAQKRPPPLTGVRLSVFPPADLNTATNV